MDRYLALHIQSRIRGKFNIDHAITGIGISKVQITIHFDGHADVVIPIWQKYGEDILGLFHEIYDTYGYEIADAIEVTDMRSDEIERRYLEDMNHELLIS
jgi:hypothetical protein